METGDSGGGYDPQFFEALAKAEDRHFWFRSRNLLISDLARSVTAGFPEGHRVLEVGFGTGNVLRFLKRACSRGSVFGMELWSAGIRFARARDLDLLVQGDLRQAPFPPVFDVVGMFDVLEHIPDDAGTLQAMRNLLAPGGRLMVTVPAHQALWSYFDAAAHHCRRYSPGGLKQVLSSAGYEVEYLSQFMAILFPLLLFVRKVAHRRGRAGSDLQRAQEEFRIIPLANEILGGVLWLERVWLRLGGKLPFGTSIIAVARKSDSHN
jgi:SAM-dependent methyltransferase